MLLIRYYKHLGLSGQAIDHIDDTDWIGEDTPEVVKVLRRHAQQTVSSWNVNRFGHIWSYRILHI